MRTQREQTWIDVVGGYGRQLQNQELINVAGEIAADYPVDAPAPVDPLVYAIDVSSHQKPEDVRTFLQDHPEVELVVCRLYLDIELGGQGEVVSRALLQVAHDEGRETAGYFWAYPDADPTATAVGVLRYADLLDSPIIWADCEPYEGGPVADEAWLSTCLAAIEHNALFGTGIYTAAWCWPASSNCSEYPLWVALYNQTPTLDVPLFGGWEYVTGHQYSDITIDRSVFRRDVVLP